MGLPIGESKTLFHVSHAKDLKGRFCGSPASSPKQSKSHHQLCSSVALAAVPGATGFKINLLAPKKGLGGIQQQVRVVSLYVCARGSELEPKRRRQQGQIVQAMGAES